MERIDGGRKANSLPEPGYLKHLVREYRHSIFSTGKGILSIRILDPLN